MSKSLFFDFTVDKENKTIHIKREFAADRATVWDAFTQSGILDQWWAPKPWRAKTKKQEFREGGQWHYAMMGPNGEEHWAVATYGQIQPKTRFTAKDAFCDKDGNISPGMPQSKWEMNFKDQGENTLFYSSMIFSDLAQLEQTIAMGFKEGMAMAMENLDKIFENK
jgi:uncharacterized protein YndB with AHSA1/START domain